MPTTTTIETETKKQKIERRKQIEATKLGLSKCGRNYRLPLAANARPAKRERERAKRVAGIARENGGGEGTKVCERERERSEGLGYSRRMGQLKAPQGIPLQGHKTSIRATGDKAKL